MQVLKKENNNGLLQIIENHLKSSPDFIKELESKYFNLN
jgi:hypothetical protein